MCEVPLEFSPSESGVGCNGGDFAWIKCHRNGQGAGSVTVFDGEQFMKFIEPN